MDVIERLNWKAHAKVEKWHRSEDYGLLLPDETIELDGNMLLNAGITRLGSLLTGGGGTAFNTANSRLGVGNGTAAAAAGQTDLQGASKFFKLCSSASWSAQTGTWVATFASADANFAWEEWGIDNGTIDGATVTAPLLNRKVGALGTKASGSTWQLTATITIS